MSTWSYIPYISYPKTDADAAFHPAMQQAAFRRLQSAVFRNFLGVSMERHKFLQRLLDGVLRHEKTATAYEVVLESFGIPLFRLRNLAHTLQDPLDRMVYIIHLEDSLHAWLQFKQDTSMCWEFGAAAGLVIVLGICMTMFLKGILPTHPIPSPLHYYPLA
jgi:hypothetical protein